MRGYRWMLWGWVSWAMMAALVTVGPARVGAADEPPKGGDSAATQPGAQQQQPDGQRQREAQLRALLSGSRLAGHFTIDREGPPQLRQDEYQIVSAEKLPTGDLWLLTVRIRYGDKDVTVPLPLPIKWADSTPVITLDQLTIPGLGTFDARVVISGHRYAGTWQHGDIGGHLFGRIEKNQDAPR